MSVAGVSSLDRKCLEPIDILVLAGGLGTRLRSVLGDVPKLLAPIAGRPYLAYLLDWLHGFGARRVVLGLGHQAQAVLDYLRANPLRSVTIVPVIEPKLLGTAGAVRFARRKVGTDPVLVMNGDSLVDADLCMLVSRHTQARACGTVLCAEVDDASRYGRVTLDQAGHIQGFVEKDLAHHSSAVVSTGIYLLSAPLLDEIARGDTCSLERDVFERLPAGSLATLTVKSSFIDIGTPEALAAAPRVLDGFRFDRGMGKRPA
jgi:NDP-sugar pyrophosphorylase family protein